MAVLIVELHGTRRGAVLPRRVLIGRRPMNHLVLDHAAVSRLHAWIDGEGDRFYINDAGSRGGTRVNGQRIVARHLLGDGDEITIGPGKMTFLAEARVRPGVEAFDLSVEPPAPDDGLLFPCPDCAAPLWAAKDFAGRTGQCRYCGHDLVVPRPKKKRRQHAPLPARPPLTEEEAARLTPDREGRDPRDAFAEPLPAGVPEAAEPAAAAEVFDDEEPASPPAPPSATAPTPTATGLKALFDSTRGLTAGGKADETVAARAAPAAAPAPAPAPAALPAAPAQAPPRRGLDQVCGVCQSPISMFEEQTSCPSCGLVFHAECWAENYGCSAYGCSQVDALKPPGPPVGKGGAGGDALAGESDPGSAEAADPGGDGGEVNRFPWEFLLLAGSVFSALLGALTFGVPSLALAGGTIAWMARTRTRENAGAAAGVHRGPHRGVVLLSTGLAVLGMLTGAAVSYFWYFGGAHL